jgi:tetratricopeptide (TPR) repeat protein
MPLDGDSLFQKRREEDVWEQHSVVHFGRIRAVPRPICLYLCLMASDVQTEIRHLRRAFAARNVSAGFAILDRLEANKLWPRPGAEGSSAMLLLLAQWCDLGYRDLDFFLKYLKAFDKRNRRLMSVSDYLDLRLAEAYAQLSQGSAVEANKLLGALLDVHADTLPSHSLFLAWFWRARAQRAENAFNDALHSVRSAKEIVKQSGEQRLEAVTSIQESWLIFHRGERRQAHDLLDEAERVLKPTGHALSLGDIAAARGRYHRSAGDYTRALTFYEQAIHLYRSQAPRHPNLARALVNAAYVMRLQALTAQPSRSGKALAATHERVLQIMHEAMQLLNAAREIYVSHHHEAGVGSVLIHMGHLQLESGDMDAATLEADAAFHMAEVRSNIVLKTRARILQAYVQMTRSEEQMESSWSSISPSQYAVDLAEEAIELAKQTQNKRLMAAAQITRGLAATDLAQADWDLALRCASKASELLASEERDHLFSELTALRKKIAQSQSFDLTWRRWINGETDGKTYQQIEEDFAAVIIPQLWLKFGQNVSRVADHLKMSPKRVRRALRNAETPAGTSRRAMPSSGRISPRLP